MKKDQGPGPFPVPSPSLPRDIQEALRDFQSRYLQVLRNLVNR